MALLRQCLNDLRTRRLSAHDCALALAGWPDSVVPPLDRHEIEALLAGHAGTHPAAKYPAPPSARPGPRLATVG